MEGQFDVSLESTDSKGSSSHVEQATSPSHNAEPVRYRLYKRRFAGAFGVVLLNIVGGMNWPWFGPIANNSTFSPFIVLTSSIVCFPTGLAWVITESRYNERRFLNVVFLFSLKRNPERWRSQDHSGFATILTRLRSQASRSLSPLENTFL